MLEDEKDSTCARTNIVYDHYFFQSFKNVLSVLLVQYCILGFQCPDKIKELVGIRFTFRDKCYLFLPTRETWESASSNCRRWGAGISGKLLNIPDHENLNSINKELHTELPRNTSAVWIGLKLRQGRWKWATGISYLYL